MPQTDRQCGGCNICCTTMKVSPLNKPAGVSCGHITEAGCGNYENRPEVCRTWYCMWVRDTNGILSDEERPDKLGVFFTATLPDHETKRQTLYAHEILPGAAENSAARATIQRLSRYVPIQFIPARNPITPVTMNGQPLHEAA